jgi:ribonucleoside-diphosphate reductase alpha chain
MTSAIRRRLPDDRAGLNHKFNVAGYEGYVTLNCFEDGTPGELFITMAKEGSTVGGLMDTIGILTSVALQHGVPFAVLVEKMRDTRFDPSEQGKASSIIDYIFRWVEETVANQQGN